MNLLRALDSAYYREIIKLVSNYFIILCTGIFLFENFIAFFIKSDKERGGIYWRQRFWMILVHGLMFLDLTLVTRNWAVVVFAGLVMVGLAAIILLTEVIYKGTNRFFLNNMCMLLGTGLCVICRLSVQKAIKQFIIIMVAFCFCMFVPLLIQKFYGKLHKYGWIYGTIGVVLLSLVFILGEVSHGSKLSISAAGFTFQASEFVKILFVFFLASVMIRSKNLTFLFLGSFMAAIHVMVLVVSKDLGAALIFFMVYLAVLFVATRKWYSLPIGLIGGGIASVIAYRIFPHVRIRVLAFIDPWKYIDNKGYQITQSLFAIGTGNWFGLGIGQGNPGDIPYVETDFIFASICEELGVVFGMMLILVVLSCFIMIMKMAVENKNLFHRLICTGFGVSYIFQVFLTIGGGIKFIPLTGVTLPFVSYGGSSVFASMLVFYIVLGFSGVKEQEESVEIKSNNFVRFLIAVFVLVYAGMLTYLGYFTATREQDMVNNSYNSRQELILSRNYRGNIMDRDGVILAQTQFDENYREYRVYPYGKLFAHVVGYHTNGKMGVEGQANYYLINTDISITQKASNDAAGIKNPGNDVYTTLDFELQQSASKSLGVYKGAVIVTDCRTGEILALVSKPDFDPNNIEEMWDELIEDSKSSVLLNRVYQGVYPPGSTFKIVTALEYYREFEEKIGKYSYTCNGSYSQDGVKIKCYHGMSHGTVDFSGSFSKSCNSSFANIGMKLDRDEFQDTLDGLMFNQPLPLTVNYSRSSAHVSDDMGTEAMMQTAIGQGKTQITPIHLNMITCAIANDGVLMNPYVVDRVVSADGKLVKQFKPQQYGPLMTSDEADFLRKQMVKVVTDGTGRSLKGASFTSGGKTGSAEYNNVKGDSHAWFTGFAPAENPEICVTVIIEGAGSGGDYAVPVAKKIMETYFEKQEAGN